MDSLRQKVIEVLTEENGLTDKEIALKLHEFVQSEHPISNICDVLERQGVIKRIKRIGKPSANYLAEDKTSSTLELASSSTEEDLFEEPIEIPSNALHSGELVKLGFEYCGDWTSVGERIVPKIHYGGERSNVLYALVIDGTLVYLSKSRRPLNHKLKNIMSGGGSPQEKRIHRFIKGIMKRGRKVEIHFLSDPGTLQYQGHRISLTAGIEETLVEFFRPVWNVNEDRAA